MYQITFLISVLRHLRHLEYCPGEHKPKAVKKVIWVCVQTSTGCGSSIDTPSITSLCSRVCVNTTSAPCKGFIYRVRYCNCHPLTKYNSTTVVSRWQLHYRTLYEYVRILWVSTKILIYKVSKLTEKDAIILLVKTNHYRKYVTKMH